MAVKDEAVKVEVVESVFTPFDPWRPVLKNSPSLQTTEEQQVYIKEILDICCSDSMFAKKCYSALQYILTGTPPVPATVTSLNPSTVVLGSESFDIHVMGSGFTAESIIVFNGYDEPTTFVSDTELTTGVNMPLWQAPAVVPVAVKNGDLVSESVNFEFTAPVLLSVPDVPKKEYEIKDKVENFHPGKSVEHKGQEKK